MSEEQTEALPVRLAKRLCDGISTGHDWPNTDDELLRMQSASELRRLHAENELLRAQIGQGEPVAWSPALDYPQYEKERVWCNGKPRQEDIDYWEKHGNGITLAYTHPAPQQKPLDLSRLHPFVHGLGKAILAEIMEEAAHNIGEKK